MILLIHESEGSSMVALPAKYIVGESVPERTYSKEGRFLALDGPAHIIAHDAEDICRIPGWRLATPAEQNAYARGQRKAGELQESRGTAKEEDKPPLVQKSTTGLYEALR